MGDARLVNAIVDGADVAALVDFEVAYVGNPIGDIGYSLFLERSHGHTAPLPGLPTGGRDVGALERGDRARARRPRLLDGVRRDRDRRHRDAGERDVGPTRLVLRGPPGAAPAVGVGRRGAAQ